jgi:hypothetical protein
LGKLELDFGRTHHVLEYDDEVKCYIIIQPKRNPISKMCHIDSSKTDQIFGENIFGWQGNGKTIEAWVTLESNGKLIYKYGKKKENILTGHWKFEVTLKKNPKFANK